jgi:hypothetical protein
VTNDTITADEIRESSGLGGGSEKRGAVRLPLRFMATLTVPGLPGADGSPVYLCQTCDISVDGASVAFPLNLTSQNEMTLVILLPSQQPGGAEQRIQVTVKRVYTVYSAAVDGFRVGLAFKQFVGDGKKLLRSRLGIG